MSLHTLRGGVVWVGLASTSVFVLVGLWTLVSRVWASSFTQTLEVLVASPFLAGWALSPLLWASWPRKGEEDRADDDQVVSFAAALLMVVLGIAVYLSELVIRPRILGSEPGREALALVLAVPAAQWVILGLAVVARLLLTRASEDSS